MSSISKTMEGILAMAVPSQVLADVIAAANQNTARCYAEGYKAGQENMRERACELADADYLERVHGKTFNHIRGTSILGRNILALSIEEPQP